MSIYFFIYIISFIFSYCYSKCKSKDVRIVFLILTFLSLFLPLALRYNIGTDYKNYVSVLEPAMRGYYNDDWELGWNILITFMRKFQINIHFFFVFGAFFTILFVMKTLSREYFYLCIPIFVSVQYLESFSLVRQALAVAILMYALKTYSERRRFKGILLIALACCFHESSFVLFLVLPFFELKYKYINNYTCCLVFGTIYIALQILHLGEKILVKSFSFIPLIAVYMSSQFNQATKMGSGLGLLLREMIVFVPLLFLRKQDFEYNTTIKKGKTVILKSLDYNMFFILSALIFSADILSGQIHIFNRLVNLFTMVYVYEAQLILKSKSKYRKILICWLLLCYFVIFAFSVYVEKSSNKGGLGITPYQSIFCK